MQAIGINKVRVGDPRDKGMSCWMILTALRACSILFGIGLDVSWDRSLAERGPSRFSIRPHSFGAAGQASLVSVSFHPSGSSIGRREPVTDTLAHLMEMNSGPDGDLILKMDIEGDEWEVFARLAPEIFKRFRQIVGEFHGLHEIVDMAWRERAACAFTHLTQYHQVIHLHRNNIVPLVVAGDVQVPAVMGSYLCAKKLLSLFRNSGAFSRPPG